VRCSQRDLTSAGVAEWTRPRSQVGVFAHVFESVCLFWPWAADFCVPSVSLPYTALQQLTVTCNSTVCPSPWLGRPQTERKLVLPTKLHSSKKPSLFRNARTGNFLRIRPTIPQRVIVPYWRVVCLSCYGNGLTQSNRYLHSCIVTS
jgi:hypothetical protein